MTRRTRIIGAVAGLLGFGLALLIGPSGTQLNDTVTGDAAVGQDVLDAVPDRDGYDQLAVAMVEDGDIRTAGLGGADPDRLFEIGSIAKAMTGMALADMVDDGVVSLDDRVGDLLPELDENAEVADVTLQELATHHSGLPRNHMAWPRDWWRIAITAGGQLGPSPNPPYHADDVLEQASDVSVGDNRGTHAYSNYGFALLGQVLATVENRPYDELLTDRVLDPLGMDATTILKHGDPLPDGADTGYSSGGTAMAAWREPGYAPAGGPVWSNAHDLGILLNAVTDQQAPGQAATEPVAPAGDQTEIGLGWVVTHADNEGLGELLWHNGGTGGFSSWAGVDLDSDRGAVVLANTTQNVDELGQQMLGGAAETPAIPWPNLVLGVFFTGVALPSVIGVARADGREPSGDRLRVAAEVLGGVFWLWMGCRIGAWHILPAWLWAVAAGVFCYFTAVAVADFPNRVLAAGTNRTRRMFGAGAGLAVYLGLLVYLATLP